MKYSVIFAAALCSFAAMPASAASKYSTYVYEFLRECDSSMARGSVCWNDYDDLLESYLYDSEGYCDVETKESDLRTLYSWLKARPSKANEHTYNGVLDALEAWGYC